MMVSRPIRLGMIVPSSNTSFEPEIARLGLSLDEVSIHMSRVRVTSISLKHQALSQFSVEPMCSAGMLLSDAGLDVLAWAGTAGSWLGVEYDKALADALTKACGIVATTSTLAILESCRFMGVNRIALVTPYTDEVVNQIVITYASQGIEVVSERHLGLEHNYDFGLVSPEEIRKLALDCQSRQADALVIACTNLKATGLIDELGIKLGIPVIDSIAVTLWHALTIAKASIPGSPLHPGIEGEIDS